MAYRLAWHKEVKVVMLDSLSFIYMQRCSPLGRSELLYTWLAIAFVHPTWGMCFLNISLLHAFISLHEVREHGVFIVFLWHLISFFWYNRVRSRGYKMGGGSMDPYVHLYAQPKCGLTPLFLDYFFIWTANMFHFSHPISCFWCPFRCLILSLFFNSICISWLYLYSLV